MTDNEIHNCIDGKVNENYQRIEKLFASLTKMIASDNQEIRKSIDNLRVKVEQQNSSVKHLNEWRAEVTGAEAQKNKGFDKAVRVMGVIIAFVAILVTVYIGSQKTKKDVANMLDQYSYDISTRSWSFDKDSI